MPNPRPSARPHVAGSHEGAKPEFFAGNHVTVLRDGRQTIPAMFSAMRSAKSHVHLEYYVLEDVKWRHQRLSDLLREARSRGVQVALIFDAVGSGSTPATFFDDLDRAGAQLLRYRPLNPLRARGRWSPNTRDHRKLLIVDGLTAFVGGVNLATVYDQPASPAPRPRSSLGVWRDTDLELTGPVVSVLQRRFLEQWRSQQECPLNEADFFPRLEALGSEQVAVLSRRARLPESPYHLALLASLQRARSRIWITAGYFIPTPAQLSALGEASRRGVDVRLILPANNDSVAALAVQRHAYQVLLTAGARIYELQGMILHSKSAIVDDDWCAVGSSNFDPRSARFNDEIDSIVRGERTVRELARLFRQDLRQSRRIELRRWRRRPWTRKCSELFWKLWAPLL